MLTALSTGDHIVRNWLLRETARPLSDAVLAPSASKPGRKGEHQVSRKKITHVAIQKCAVVRALIPHEGSGFFRIVYLFRRNLSADHLHRRQILCTQAPDTDNLVTWLSRARKPHRNTHHVPQKTECSRQIQAAITKDDFTGKVRARHQHRRNVGNFFRLCAPPHR